MIELLIGVGIVGVMGLHPAFLPNGTTSNPAQPDERPSEEALSDHPETNLLQLIV
jgi:hypothetical protein